MHQASGSSSDTVFGAELVATVPVVPVVTPLLSIDDKTVWSYDRSGLDLGTAWKDKTFDDSKWPTGKALIADESTTTVEPIRTPISRFDEAGTHITTFYYRGRFNLDADPAKVSKLRLRHVVDDGAVFYLNGTEINRLGLAADATFDFSTFFADHENAYAGPFDIPVNLLVKGENTLAAEVHQASGSSSDMVFGAELIATILSSGGGTTTPGGGEITLSISRSGGNITVSWTAGAATLQRTASLTAPVTWTDVGGTSPATIAIGAGNLFLRVKP